jgi:hypothetical protein
MTENARKSIDYIVADIARIQAEMPGREVGYQAEDREAFEIVRRIERRLQGKRVKQPAE